MFEGWKEAEISEYQARRRILEKADSVSGSSKKKAAAAGVSYATLYRLRELWQMVVDSGNHRLLLRSKSPGRPAVAKHLSQDAVNRLRRQRIKCGSTALTIQHFADDPLCPDSIREKILAMKDPHTIPISLRRACNVTPEMEALYRGPVAYQHVAFKCRHEPIVIDPVTQLKRDLMAGDIYISDDMSRNRYFWFELDDPDMETRSNRGDKLAQKYGVALGRQGLYTMDGRGKWLGLTLIGCARDAYTSADVLRHMREILAEYGKPRLGWILEKGCWAARKVDGEEIWATEEERMNVVGGLRSLGFSVDHVHTSEGKALIEVGFNQLQRVQALQEGAPDIGRKRGEMERETKLILRIQAGVMHPAEAGLEHFTEALGLDRKACSWMNARKKFGRIQNGIPDENWVRDTTRFALKKLEPQDMGVFMPIKFETEIRHGCVEKKIAGRSFRFTMPELFGELGAEYRLYVMFDDSNPAAGAEIYNLETGTRNIRNWKFMEHLGNAEWEKERPLFGYSDEVAESSERRRRNARAFKAAYAGTGIFGKRAATAIETRDGRGNLSSISVSGMSAVAPAKADEATRPAKASFIRQGRSGVGLLPNEDASTDSTSSPRTDFRSKRSRKILNRLDLVEA